MKKNDLVELKTLEIPALLEKVKKLKEEMADLIIDKNLARLKDLKVISKKRKDLAQILTMMGQKRLLSELELGNVVEEVEGNLKEEKIEVKKSKEKTGGKQS